MILASRFDGNVRLYRVCDETIGWRLMMERRQLCFVHHNAGRESYARAKRHTRHPQLSAVSLLKPAARVVVIAVEGQAPARADREKRQHMTTAQRSDKCFLRMHPFRIAEELRRCGRGQNDLALLEQHRMRAVVVFVGEILDRLMPAKLRGMFCIVGLSCSYSS